MVVRQAAEGPIKTREGTQGTRQKTGLAKFKDIVLSFVSISNGEFYMNGKLVHYCFGPRCCSNPQESRHRMAAALAALPLASVPVTPHAKSWTALGPCIDKVLSLVAIGGTASPLLKIAYSKMNLETDSGDRANDGIAHDEVDPRMQKHLSFHKIAGKRLAASKIVQRSSQPILYFCCRVCA